MKWKSRMKERPEEGKLKVRIAVLQANLHLA